MAGDGITIVQDDMNIYKSTPVINSIYQNHYLPMNKSVAIYGGAFNPPTNAHHSVIKTLLWEYDEVWITPSYNHAFDKDMLPYDERLAMCKLMVKNDRVKVFEIEKELKPENTYELVLGLLKDERFTGYDFVFAMGLDNANIFGRWKNSEDLKNMIPFAIIPRPGHDIDYAAWYMENPHKVMEHHEESEISSSMVREMLSTDLTEAKKHVPKKVLKHILSKKLYMD